MNIKDLPQGAYKPVVSTSTQPKMNINNLAPGSFKPVVQPQNKGIIRTKGEEVLQPFERIGTTILNKVAPNLKTDSILGNEIAPITSGKEFAGETVKGLSNFIGGGALKEGAKVAGKSILKRVVPKLANVTKNVVVPGAVAGGVYGGGQSMVQNDTLPEAVKNIGENAAYGAGGALALGVGLPAVVKPVVNTVRGALRRTTQEGRNSIIIANKVKELENLDSNYVAMRRAQGFSPDANKSTIQRIAGTDVLEKAVDENGLIRTKVPGGPVDQYKAQTIDGVEGVVRANLERNQEMVNLADVERKLLDTVRNSGMEGSDLNTSLNNVAKEIEGYRLRADANGNVPLTLIHDAKISTTKGINYMTPPEVKTYRKSIAKGLKEIVEENSSFNTKEVNQELAKFYNDINFLERLDGKRVKGGKLSKNFAQISGNIIGGSTGHAVGGPFGSAIGAIIGGELAGKIRGSAMSKVLGGKTGKVAPKSTILEKAKDLSTKTGGIYSNIRGSRNSTYKPTQSMNSGTMPRSVPINKPTVKTDIPSKQTLRAFMKKEPVPQEPVKPELPGNQIIRDRMLKKAIDEQAAKVEKKSIYEPITPDSKLPVINAGGKTVSKFKKVDKSLPTLAVGGLAVLGTAGQEAKADEGSDFDWETTTSEGKKKLGFLPGTLKFERKKITHPENIKKFEEMYKYYPENVKEMIDAMAKQESLSGKKRVNEGDQKDGSDSLGLLHMGQNALNEFNKRKEYFGYTGPDLKIEDLKEENADIIQKFVQASRIMRDMRVNNRSLERAATFIQNQGEKNYGLNAIKKFRENK